MSEVAWGVVCLLAAVHLLVMVIAACVRVNPLLLWLLLPLGFGALLYAGPFGFMFVVLWELWQFTHWEPVRGLFTMPPWPRSAVLRGPGRRRRREFREPMPWTRGPNSY